MVLDQEMSRLDGVTPVEPVAGSSGGGEPGRLPRYEQRSFKFYKRTVDIVIGSLALLFLLPLFSVMAFIVILSDGMPVFFRHRRVGQNGEMFEVYKFRTMRRNAEEILRANPELLEEFKKNFKLRHDPRLIRFGQFMRTTTLDELPQFLNVVKGEMSLVGPRPIVPSEAEKYGEDFRYYLKMKPGCAGLWQCSGRSDVDYQDRVRMTRQYYEEASVRRDLLILWRTFVSILKREGAY
jgi:exopolysaccharide production protein ExoY